MMSYPIRLEEGSRSSLSEAAKVSLWCSQYGLEFLKDYEWEVRGTSTDRNRTLVIHFATHCEEIGTLFALDYLNR